MDIFRCIPGFIKAADLQFPPKFTAKYIWFSGSEITGKLAGNQSWCFQNGVFTSQRRKKVSLEPQTNKIIDYLSAKFDATSIVMDVLELIDTCNPVYCAACQILKEFVTNFETESSHSSCENMSEKTIKSWTKRYHTYEIAGLGGSVGCTVWLETRRSRVRPRRGRQHSFVEIDHEIFSTVILSLPLIQEGQLSVSGERMCTILVNCLED